jgi:hypothetical protein
MHRGQIPSCSQTDSNDIPFCRSFAASKRCFITSLFNKYAVSHSDWSSCHKVMGTMTATGVPLSSETYCMFSLSIKIYLPLLQWSLIIVLSDRTANFGKLELGDRLQIQAGTFVGEVKTSNSVVLIKSFSARIRRTETVPCFGKPILTCHAGLQSKISRTIAALKSRKLAKG